jgi:hypothetical protein
VSGQYSRFEAFRADDGYWAVLKIVLSSSTEGGGSALSTKVVKEKIPQGEAVGIAANANRLGYTP